MKKAAQRLFRKDKVREQSRGQSTASGEGPADTVDSSSAISSTVTFVTGLRCIAEPKDGSDAVVDIVFVHGITGNREGTWTADKAPSPWPGTFLAQILPQARILLFGYDARVVKPLQMVSRGRISDHARQLLNSLSSLRDFDETNERPLVFVAHSMGGLVCEDALLHSNSEPDAHLKNILSSTKAIAFLGTPHGGARGLAEWASRLAKAVGLVREVNTDLVSLLETDSEVLARIQQGFHTMVRARRESDLPEIKITCFYEQVPLRLIGYVVSPQSAILPGYNPIPLNKDHMGMTKFQTEDDPDYQLVRGELLRWYRSLIPAEDRSKTAPIATIRRPRDDKETAALQYKSLLQLSYDAQIDQYRVTMPHQLIMRAGEHPLTFGTVPVDVQDSPFAWQKLLHMFQDPEADQAHQRRHETFPLSMIPWQNGVFLARIITTDLFRILASRVSQRQKYESGKVIVHSFGFMASGDHHDSIPIIKIARHHGDGHYLPDTTFPSTEHANAFVSTGALKPSVPYNFKLMSSMPGFEKVQMPYLLALYEIPSNFNVLFRSQVVKAFLLWQVFVIMLAHAWDHEDAFECDSELVPIKKHVDKYRAYAQSQRLRDYDTREPHAHISGWLKSVCAQYFREHPDMVIENEDVVRNIQKVEVVLTSATPSASNNANLDTDPGGKKLEEKEKEIERLVEDWFALYGFEGGRWLLIALTVTLGHNFSSVQGLPVSFEVLVGKRWCYVT